MSTIVVYGPPACGKTRAAQALAAHFRCHIIVDDWDPRRHAATPDALHLTNCPCDWAVNFADIVFDRHADVGATRQSPRYKPRYSHERCTS